MNVVQNFRPTFLLLASLVITFVACTPAVENVADTTVESAESRQRQPVFRSAKMISSVCEVDQKAFTFPGFKEVPGKQVQEMLPPVAGMMAVGAPANGTDRY